MDPGIFYEHLLYTPDPVALPRNTESTVWPSVYAILALFVLAALRLRSYPRVVKIVQSVFSRQFLQKLEREETNPFTFHSIFLTLLFVLNAGFLCYKVNSYYHLVFSEMAGLTQFALFSLVVLGVIVLKAAVNGMLALLTGNARMVSEFMIVSFFSLQTFGLFMFPVIILMQFTTLNPLLFLSAGLILFATSVLVKWYRGVMLGLVEGRVGLLQILSYFCALEILPTLVLVKFIVENF